MANSLNPVTTAKKPGIKQASSEVGGLSKDRIKQKGRNRIGGGTIKDIKIPQDKPGNSKGDQAFFSAEAQKGMIVSVDEDELDELPFGVKHQWIGDTEDLDSYWSLPPEDRRCSGWARVRDIEGRPIVNAEGHAMLRPCGRHSIKGGNVCPHHGGGVEKVKRAAQLRLVAAADSLIGQLIKIAMDDKNDAKARVMAINSALDRAGVTGKMELEISIPAYKELANNFASGWSVGDDSDG